MYRSEFPEDYTREVYRSESEEYTKRNTQQEYTKVDYTKEEYTPMMYRSEFPEDYTREEYTKVNQGNIPKRNVPK